MKHIVKIEGIRIYAYHGCLDIEATTGQAYTIDVHAETDFSEAAATDDLSKAVDYCVVYEICKEQMKTRNKLIEPVCMRIHRAIRDRYPAIIRLTVKLTKPSPPVSGDVESASVEIHD